MERAGMSLGTRADLGNPQLARRVVVKVGSSSLTDTEGHLDGARLGALVQALATRRAAGTEVVLVSSGAIAAALQPLGLPARPRDLATAQAAASVGQGLLIAEYTRAFARHGLQVGQVLLTADDVINRGHYRNAQRALGRLLELGIVPIINENDAIATAEIRFGDNDRLAALVSHLVRADALVLLSDVDALYSAPPHLPGAHRIETVARSGVGAEVTLTDTGSAVGTGGMLTKTEAAAVASGSGVPVLLTSAAQVEAALAGENVGTWFEASNTRISTRRLWLAHAAQVRGQLVLDAGAVAAITTAKRSLLAAGITQAHGDFEAGDPVELLDPQGAVVARGIVAYDSAELPARLGVSSSAQAVAGTERPRAVVHRDNLVLATRFR